MNEMVGYSGAAQITGLKQNTLYALVHQQRIPHHRLSRRLVLFRVADLHAWLDQHHVAVAGPKARQTRTKRGSAPTTNGEPH